MAVSYYQLHQRLSTARSVLIITHQQPDGDACGSSLALALTLKRRGLRVGVYTADEPAVYFDYLPGRELISTDPALASQAWDTVVVLDASNWAHTRLPDQTLSDLMGRSQVIIVDHHSANRGYGHQAIIDPRASSVCEMLYRYFTEYAIIIDRSVAMCLLSGIVTDTSTFSNGATTIESMAAASQLIRHGAAIHQILDHVMKNKSLPALRLWGVVLARLRVSERYGVAYTYVGDDDFRTARVGEEALDGLVNFLNVLAGHAFVLLLRVTGEQAKVSMRTTRPDINLGRLAQHFGGGGHQKAAGFSVPWPIAGLELPTS